MVNPAVLFIAAIGAILIFTSLPKIIGAFKNGEDQIDSPDINIDEGDTTIIIDEDELNKKNQEQKEKDFIGQNGETSTSKTEETDLTKAFESGKFLEGITSGQALEESKFIDTKTEQEFSPDLTFEEAQAEREELEESIDPKLKASTSLEGAPLIFGEQIKRDDDFEGESITDLVIDNTSSDFQKKLKQEQEKAEKLFAQLFGSVQNPDF